MGKWQLVILYLTVTITPLGVMGWAYWLAHRRLPPPVGETQTFRPAKGERLIGGIILLGALGFILPILFIPFKPQDWLPFLLLALFFGLSPWVGLWLWTARFRLDDAGIVAYNVWGMPRFIAWHEVQQIRLSTAWQGLVFISPRGKVYVWAALDNWQGFLQGLQQRLPATVTLPTILLESTVFQRDGERLAFEGHWQALYRTAPYWLLASIACIALSMLLVPPESVALLWAGAGGAVFALTPLLYAFKPQLWDEDKTWLGNFIQATAFVAVIFATQNAYSVHERILGGADAVTEAAWLGMLLQHLGMAFTLFFGLIVLVKWLFPRRFSSPYNPKR